MLASPAAKALSFEFICNADPGCVSINSNVFSGFQTAAARWSSLLFDPITVRVRIGFTGMASNILGGAQSTSNFFSYSNFRLATGLDRQTDRDQQAYASLSAGSAFGLLINRTLDNPNGAGSATPYVDAVGLNNVLINLTTANAKALGFSPDYATDALALDGDISFNSNFSWDFNPDDGVAAGTIDFVAVATHEIGHVLGFISGVDILDENSTGTYFSANTFIYVNPLDLYRYSSDSRDLGVIDWTADARDKYFSTDAGLTNLGGFSTGRVHGDGRQASHWKDNLSLGLMDPTIAYGELGLLSALDLVALDVIGYNTIARAPAPLPLLGTASVLLWSRRLRRRQRHSTVQG